MDERLRRAIRELAVELATKESYGSNAGTLIDIEVLTAEIGDEIARQLASIELQKRSDSITENPSHQCPDCGQDCQPHPDPEPIILDAIRGDIEYSEPRCFCSRCRRDFFPDGRTNRTSPKGNRLAETA